jgi:hypothetical protein
MIIGYFAQPLEMSQQQRLTTAGFLILVNLKNERF